MPVLMNTSMLGTVPPEALESAAKEVDQQLNTDRRYPELSEQLKASSYGSVTVSGINDFDYPSLSSTSSPALSTLDLLSPVKHVPLPPELLKQFAHMQCNCNMGVFPQIHRAWLSIDSDIFVWNYEDGGDLAYFDGLDETILTAGLVHTRPGVFQDHIKFLLCLTTPVDIVLLGVSFTEKNQGQIDHDLFGEMHLQPDPLFSISSDNVHFTSLTSTMNGRIFLCGKDGCVYELSYQAGDSWFRKKCRKINHSSSSLGFFVPSFLSFSFSGEDPIIQLAVDNTRNILYSRSEKGNIQVFDLGADGEGMSLVGGMSQDNILYKASSSTRAVDRSHFKPIVHIAPVPKKESVTVHLVAITQSGVRLYFTTSPYNSPNIRPSTLTLVHIRMPPGHAPSAAPQRPTNVHAAYYTQGTSLLAATHMEDSDILWTVSPDTFPFQNPYKEAQVSRSLDGHIWALSEIPAFSLPVALPCPIISVKWPEPPAVVTQHTIPPKKFVLLTAQGSYILTLLRPVEQLRQLLISNGGPDADAVQAFFKLHREDQACATALILACSTLVADREIAEWATQAFFKYGGESCVTVQAQTTQATTTPGLNSPGTSMQAAGGSGSFISTPVHPSSGGVMTGTPPSLYGTRAPMSHSTPAAPPTGATGRAVQFSPDYSRSGCHNGLCLFIARLLGPIWDQKIVADDPTPQTSFLQRQQVQARPVLSRFTSLELSWFRDQMEHLNAFLDRNAHFALQFLNARGLYPVGEGLQRSQAEKNSLLNLKYLVSQCCEILSLWRILCDNNFPVIVQGLDQATLERLKQTRFRDLLINGKELCTALITALMNCLLTDAASTDTISTAMRDLCPSLFSMDDAVCTKANELLAQGMKISNKFDQEKVMKEALQLYRKVTQQIDLPGLCTQFHEVGFYEGIVDLTQFAAKERDPKGLALHFYKNGEPSGDTEGHEAFLARNHCYDCLLSSMDKLLFICNNQQQSPMIPSRPGPPPAPEPDVISPQEAEKHIQFMIHEALKSRDELFHVSFYEWRIKRGMTDKLLEIQSAFLEPYLKLKASQNPDNTSYLDLLWKYYEKNKNYAAAAQILTKLADREGTDVGLVERLEYLSRALMSAKSVTFPTSPTIDGKLLHVLEEKLEVARIQLQVYEALSAHNSSRPSADGANALKLLNSQLLDISRLYSDFADEFGLSQCKLAIVHCAGHYDPALIDTLWKEIIQKELDSCSHLHPQDAIPSLSSKLVSLGRMYANSERYFPLDSILLFLEKKSCTLDWDISWVFATMLEIGIMIQVLHCVYDRIFKTKDQYWIAVRRPLHILQVIHHLISRFLDNPNVVAPFERRSFTRSLFDACATYLVEIESMSSSDPAVPETMESFKELQARLRRALEQV